VAFNKNSGKEIWRSLKTKEPGYCPPMIYEINGKRQLIIWHPESINGLNPETGEVYWTFPWKIQSELSVSTPRVWKKDHLFFTAFYNGSLMLDLSSGKPVEVWRSRKVSERDTDALHSIISTPAVDDENIYGVCSYGELRCLKAATGERLWETLQATTTNNKPTRWANAFLIRNGDRYFLANEKGDIIIAKLTASGYEEVSRAHILDPINSAPGRDVVWSHPAFANHSVYMRNDKELVCVELKAN